MRVTSNAHPVDPAACMAEVERIIESERLRGSEALCKMLRYLAGQSFTHPGAPPKEYQIATELFGRPSNFDPQSDSTTRVQAGRLRTKLNEYFASEGAEDPILVDMPKGSYQILFHTRDAVAAFPFPQVSAGRAAEMTPKPLALRSWQAMAGILSLLLVLAVGFAVWSWGAARDAERAAAALAEPAPPEPLRLFWKHFVAGSSKPWVVFSNGAFVGRPETGMRYFDARRDSPDMILDHYTGVGEVLAVHELDGVFSLMRQPLRVKRASLLSLDDTQNNNLIFVGSPAENLPLLDLPGTHEFRFRRMDFGPRRGDLAIINVHPRLGEPSFFLSSSSRPLSEDYALVAVLKGPNPALSMMILAGMTTIGTEAAVEFVCRESSLKDLLNRLQLGPAGEVRPFEMVLRVKVKRGVPMDSEIVVLR